MMWGRSIDVGCLAIAMALAWSTGCSGEDHAYLEEGDATGGTDEAGSNQATTTAEPPSDPDSTGGDSADDTGLDEGTGGGECEIDCGEGGYCDLDQGDEPVCACYDGYVAYGLRCLPCTATQGDFDLEIPSVDVSATFLLRGEPFPLSGYQRGAILLRDPATGDEVVLGDTRHGGTSNPVPVIPGNYEVHYARRAGGLEVPANVSARLATVHIPDTGTHALVVDVPAVDLRGDIHMNGATPPTGIYENGSIVLREPTTGDEVVLGDTRHGDYRAMVVPGRYDVHYRRKLAQAEAPINRDARFTTIDVTDDGDGSQTLDLDVPVTMLSGTFTLDGAAPPEGIYENGRIVLRDTQTGDEVVLGQTREGSYQTPVVPGSYEVVYRRLLGGAVVPVNTAAVLQQTTFEAGEQPLDIDIATAIVTGTITVGGVPAPADPTDDGLVFLRNPESGDEALLGNTADGSYARRVVQGSYDVFYRQETSSGGVPANTNAWLEAIDVTGGAAYDVDVPMVTVSAAVTVGGALPPESAYDDGLLYLRNPETGDSVLLGNTRLASLERPVVPGTYDLVYVVEAPGPTMPINAKAHLGTVNTDAMTDLVVDIPGATLQGSITVAGKTPPPMGYDHAMILLHDVATADTISLSMINTGAYARTITAGTYVVAYQMLSTTGLVPANANAGLACVELTAP